MAGVGLYAGSDLERSNQRSATIRARHATARTFVAWMQLPPTRRVSSRAWVPNYDKAAELSETGRGRDGPSTVMSRRHVPACSGMGTLGLQARSSHLKPPPRACERASEQHRGAEFRPPRLAGGLLVDAPTAVMSSEPCVQT